MNTIPNHSVPYRSIEIYFVDPLSIVIPDEFADRDPPPEEILEMAVSIHRHGQRRPLECSKDASGRWVLVHGFIRLMAGRMILQGFKHFCDETNSEIETRDKRFRIKVTSQTSNLD